MPTIKTDWRAFLWQDLAQIEHIEAMSYGHFDRLNQEQLRDLLQSVKVWSHVLTTCHDDEVVGSIIFELGERSYILRRLTVHPNDRLLGHGRLLLEKLKRKIFQAKQRRKLVAYVPETWLGAQMFLRACGLLAVAIAPNAEGVSEIEFNYFG